MDLIDMKMQHVEPGRHFAYPVEHKHVVGDGVAHGWIEAKCLLAAGHQAGAGTGFSAGEQRHVMALRNQLIGEVGDYFAQSPRKAAGVRFQSVAQSGRFSLDTLCARLVSICGH